ncbi:MAG TPA: IS1595 family transposase [Verrucomicrobiae bacterium]|nr:IS1595 family transposase [Verrucomicrobiae bacterium]
MKAQLEFKTLTDFTDHFRNEETCVKHYTATRFADGEFCAHCGHKEIYSFKGGKRYRCKSCKKDFTIKTGTLFGESKLPLRKWFIAIYLLSTTSKGMSSVQLAKHVGVTQKTAWFMAHRIRAAHHQKTEKLTGTVEVDETFIGGKAKNIHAKKRREVITGTGGINKTPIFGMKTRDGEIRATVVTDATSATLHPIIRENVAEGATIYSDEWRGYAGLNKDFSRGIIRHSLGEFVKGDCHTNGIESFWALFKRGYHGVYHQMSKKHLQRYVNEYAFRFNHKTNPMQRVFLDVVQRVANTAQLPYKTLTQEPA